MTYYYAEIQDGVVVNLVESQLQMPTSPALVQTLYNTLTGVNISKEKAGLANDFCGIGYFYDANANAFYAPQPYPSWSLNTTTWFWEAPIPYPTDGGLYAWDEATQQWVLINAG